MTNPVIYWYRQDLRTRDLPALRAAAETGRPLLACYILDDVSPGEDAPGGASRWWLHHSLTALAAELAEMGGELLLRRGAAPEVLDELIEATGADAVYCSRQYEPWATELEHAVHAALAGRGIEFRRFAGTLLFEPEQVRNNSGQPFKVFTPFWRHCCDGADPARPRPRPRAIEWLSDRPPGEALESWELLPQQPDWAAHWLSLWQPGADGAGRRLAAFLAEAVGDYRDGRDFPARESTSRLSPHLHFGEISPRAVWHAAADHAADHPALTGQVQAFLRELGWREFSYHLLCHFPDLPEAPFQPRFRNFPWLGDAAQLRAWQRGRTGYPIVDAGMRELWHTGYMHNRIRMVVASFLTKHLLLHWRQGARWFWDTLVDADLANNSCSWQWVAGSGADAAPYFRIFNPVLQGQKFDGDGRYVRRWVPELAALPDRYLHKPWEAPADVLQQANVRLGDSYPHPLVDHAEAREAALAAYAAVKDA